MGFNFPTPPSDMIFPQAAQHIANVAMGVLVAAFLVFAVYELVRGRGPLALILLVGGALSYLNEPMLDVLGPLWHPRPNQDVAINTFGPAPLWGLGIYTVFFGGGTYVLYRLFRRGITMRGYWIGVAAFFAVNLAVEWPLLNAGMYRYYGFQEAPMTVGGLPLYWLFVNAGAPLLSATLLLVAPQWFRGAKVLFAVLVPMCVYSAYSMSVSWPVYTAGRIPDLNMVVYYAAACLTIALSLFVFYQVGKYWSDRARSARDGSVTSVTPSDSPVLHAGAQDRAVNRR
jgi:hypothetical protein